MAIRATVSRTQVQRDRLVGVLADRFDHRVTVVEAGAGFGKSLLLEQAMAARPAHHVDLFHRLTKGDATPASVLASLGTQLDGDATAATLDAVLDALWHRAPSRVAVILDDCHHLVEGGPMSMMLDEFINRLPENAGLVLAGRTWPPVRLQRLLAQGEAVVLGEADLAFDDEELASFAQLRDIADGRTFNTRWPALIELEAATGMTGAQRYLVEEALSGFASDRVEALRLLSVVDQFDDELVREATDYRGTARQLVSELPLVSESAAGIRPHDLWRELLSPQVSTDERRAVVRVAADLHRSRKDLVSAAALLAAEDDDDGLLDIVRELVCDHHGEYPLKVRRTVLAQTSSLLEGSLELDCLRAADLFASDPSRALGPLRAAIVRAEAAGDREMELFTIFRHGDVLYRSSGVSELEELTVRLRAMAREAVHGAAAVLGLFESWLLMLDNRYADADHRLDDPTLADFGPVAEVLPYFRTVMAAYSGFITRALADLETISASPTGRTQNRMGGFAMVQRWFLGRLSAEDRQRTLGLLDRIEEAGQTHLLVEGAASTSLFFASVGEVDQAQELLVRAERQAGSLSANGSWGLYNLSQCRAVLKIFGGDEEAAAIILRDAVPPDGVLKGVSRQVCGKLEALYYLLVPETRPDWDSDAPGPELRLGREVGRALVALREDDDPGPAAALPWAELDRLRTWAYEPHLAELALAALDQDVVEATAALESLHHDPRVHVQRALVSLPAGIAKRASKRLQSIASRPPTAVEIRVLGPTEVLLDGRRLKSADLTGRQRVHDLLLLLVAERRIRRSEVIARLWPDKDEAAGTNNLRVTLSGLNSALEPHRSTKEPTWFIRSIGEWIEFGGVEQLSLDVDRFENLVDEAQAADEAGLPQVALQSFLLACDLYRGPYMVDGADSDIGYYDRIRFRGRFAAAASRAAELSSGRGDGATAEALAARAIDADPVNERCHRALARALEQQNRVGAAREVLSVILAELADSGLSPEIATSELARRLGVGSDQTP